MHTHFLTLSTLIQLIRYKLSIIVISVFILLSFRHGLSHGAPPIFDDFPAEDSTSVREGETIEFGIGAYDPEGGAIYLTAIGLPAQASFIDEGSGRGYFSFTPDFFQAWSTYDVIFFATDDEGLTESLFITVVVIDVNQPPEITYFLPDSLRLDEGATYVETLAAIDPTDPERGVIRFVAADPLPPTVRLVLLPRTGQAIFSFVPDFDFTHQCPDTSFSIALRALDRQGLFSFPVETIFWVNDVNRAPFFEDPGPQSVNEGDTLSFMVSAMDLDNDRVVVQVENLPTGASFVDSLFQWPTSYHDAGDYEVVFVAIDDGCPPLSDTLRVAILVTDVNAPPNITSGADQTVEVEDSVSFLVRVSDADEDDSISAVVLDPPSGATFSFVSETRTGRFHWTPGPEAVGIHHLVFVCNDNQGEQNSIDRDTTVIRVTLETQFRLFPKVVLAWPGQQHVKVPVFLSNYIDSVGGWELIMEYDHTACTVIGVELCDSIAIAEGPHEGVYYAPWYGRPKLRPEYFISTLGFGGHGNRVRIVGIMDMEWPPQPNPPIPPGGAHLLFCFIVDVSPSVSGHQARFDFHTETCTDNTLSAPDGITHWGPDELSRPEWLVCPYEDAVRLDGGPGLAIRDDMERGDINCDGIAYSVADAMIFVRYLIDGPEALSGCPSFSVHCYAADIDGDGYCFTINDLMILIRIINGYEDPPERIGMEREVHVYLVEGNGETAVCIDGDGPIGAALIVLDCDGDVRSLTLAGRALGMEMASDLRSGSMRVLIYSLRGQAIDAGQGPIITISGGNVALEKLSCTDEFGFDLKVKKKTVSASFQLVHNYPNPFNANTFISYVVPEAAKRKGVNPVLKVYNQLGQVVRTLVDEPQSPGFHQAMWNGRDDRGNEVSSGIYLLQLRVGDVEITRRMALLR